jgi:hypothetical protein
MPFTVHTARQLDSLAALEPATLAIMHGSSYRGNAAKLLRGLAPKIQTEFGLERNG